MRMRTRGPSSSAITQDAIHPMNVHPKNRPVAATRRTVDAARLRRHAATAGNSASMMYAHSHGDSRMSMNIMVQA